VGETPTKLQRIQHKTGKITLVGLQNNLGMKGDLRERERSKRVDQGEGRRIKKWGDNLGSWSGKSKRGKQTLDGFEKTGGRSKRDVRRNPGSQNLSRTPAPTQ